MVNIILEKDCTKVNSDLLCVSIYEQKNSITESKSLEISLSKKISTSIKEYNFKAKWKNTLIIEGNKRFKRVLIIGLGKESEFTDDRARIASYLAIKEANKLKTSSATIFDSKEFFKEIIEGINYSLYKFKGIFQKEDKDKQNSVKNITIISNQNNAVSILKEADTVFNAVALCRDLVNLPSNVVTPTYLANEAKKIAKNKKVQLKVLSLQDAIKLKMGAFAAVAKGSKEPAKMIILEYKGSPKNKEKYAIVGKGITFDSGGISIKPSKGMKEMKTDMGGGAAALSAFKAIVTLGLKVNLITIVAATENLPGGNAFKPGDILTASNGKTIEVISTDAEGRLVLADALVYAQKMGATKIIDLATLTGACIVTFGNIHTALMSNNQKWADNYLKNAENTGEKTWQLPMTPEYDELIKSDICDMVNAVDSRKAGTITAAKLLEQFIEKDTTWLHLDIAGTSYLDNNESYYGKYATGAPVRTLIEVMKGEQK